MSDDQDKLMRNASLLREFKSSAIVNLFFADSPRLLQHPVEAQQCQHWFDHHPALGPPKPTGPGGRDKHLRLVRGHRSRPGPEARDLHQELVSPHHLEELDRSRWLRWKSRYSSQGDPPRWLQHALDFDLFK